MHGLIRSGTIPRHGRCSSEGRTGTDSSWIRSDASTKVVPTATKNDRVPEPLRWVVTYNPLAFLVQGYRDVMLEGRLPPAASFVYFTVFAGALCVVGFVLFVRVKKRFADLI